MVASARPRRLPGPFTRWHWYLLTGVHGFGRPSEPHDDEMTRAIRVVRRAFGPDNVRIVRER